MVPGAPRGAVHGNLCGGVDVSEPVSQYNGEMHTRVGRLEASVEALHSEVGNIKSGQDEIKNLLLDQGKQQVAGSKTNWSVVIGACGLCIALISALGGVFIAPLRVADSYHERDAANMESIIRADHDRITRLEEREKLYRETGMIGVR